MSVVFAAHTASSHRMAHIRALQLSGQTPPLSDHGEGALSSLNRLGQNILSTSQSSKHGRKNHSLFLCAGKSLLSHPTTEPAGQKKKQREVKKNERSTRDLEEEINGGSLDSLVPHFAKDVQAEEPSTPGTSGQLPESQSDRFWTVNWSSALEAVENVLHFAQGLNISFVPQPQEDEADTSDRSNPSPSTSASTSSLLPKLSEQNLRSSPPTPPRSFSTPASTRREALQAELDALELMLRPKCPWPRKDVATTSADHDQPQISAFLTDAPVDLDVEKAPVAVGPRCPWPREAMKAQPIAATALVTTPKVVYPRSAWPRTSTKVVQEPVYARCAWPRVAPAVAAGSKESAAVAAITSLASVAVLAAAVSHGPRCAWPREKRHVITDLSSPVAGDLIMAAPRCAWPRVARSLEVAALAAPRCAWPRMAGAVGTLSALQPAASLGSTSPSVKGPRCAWPRKAAGLPSLEIAGSRSAWPRKTTALKAAAAAPVLAQTEILTALLAWGPAEMGPRCAWPRVAKAEATTAALAVSPVLEMGPRCAWPRAVKTSAAPSLAVSTELPAPVMGPRCAWPRAVLSPAAPMLTSPVLAPAEGPRCSWPRSGAAVLAAAPALAEAEVCIKGPRCAWPRKQVAAAAESGEEVPAVPKGPRCPWPRAGPAGNPPAAAGPGARESTAEEGRPTQSEEMAWEVLPEVAEGAPKRRVQHLTTAAALSSGSSAASSPVHGARCPWPRAARQSAPGQMGPCA